MAKTAIIQTDFSAGELTPRMKGRVDTSRYQKGAETIENGVVAVHGGVDRRGGLRHLAAAKLGDERRVRVIRYVFNLDQAYLIEFGHLYVRFYTATGAVILDESLMPLELVTPYTDEQVFQLRHRQGGDTLLLFHEAIPTQRLRRLNATSWAIGPVPWITEPFAEVGVLPAGRLTLSAATVGSGRTFTTLAATVPDAPTIGTASPLKNAASVLFTPGDNGGLPVSSYTVTASPGGKTGTGATSPIRVTGLTNGTAYTFTVKATNALGDSAASSASNSVTPTSDAPASSFSVVVTPNPYYGEARNGNGKAVTTAPPVAAASGGTAPYVYYWARVGGSTNITITGANGGPSPGLRSSGYNSTNYATLRVVVTDANGAQGSADVSVAVVHKDVDGGVPV